MKDRFTTTPLHKGQVDQAFPVVQSILTRIDIETWREFARIYVGTGEGRGIVTAQADGYIYGLFSYYAENRLEHGKTLVIENFAVLDLLSPKAVAGALVAEMDNLMSQLGCHAIQAVLPNGKWLTPASRRSIVGRFLERGHEIGGITLCKAPGSKQSLKAANSNLTGQPHRGPILSWNS